MEKTYCTGFCVLLVLLAGCGSEGVTPETQDAPKDMRDLTQLLGDPGGSGDSSGPKVVIVGAEGSENPPEEPVAGTGGTEEPLAGSPDAGAPEGDAGPVEAPAGADAGAAVEPEYSFPEVLVGRWGRMYTFERGCDGVERSRAASTATEVIIEDDYTVYLYDGRVWLEPGVFEGEVWLPKDVLGGAAGMEIEVESRDVLQGTYSSLGACSDPFHGIVYGLRFDRILAP